MVLYIKFMEVKVGLFDFFRKKAGNCLNIENYLREIVSFPEEKNNFSFYSQMKYNELVGGIFWFDYKKISDSGYPSYGAYVYKKYFELFSKPRNCMFMTFDGDIIGGQSEIPLLNDFPEDRMFFQNISRRPLFGLMLAGAFDFNFALISIHFRKTSEGYLGLTKLGGANIQDFTRYAQMALFVNSLNVQNNLIHKQSFHYITDNELQKMGYRINNY